MDAFLIPFSLLWGGFAIFWELMALGVFSTMHRESSGNPIEFVFPLFGVPFVLIGLYIMVGRFFVDAKQRARTLYGVTNQRVLIISGLFSRKVLSLDLKGLTEVNFIEHRHGRGTIIFGAANFMNAWQRIGGWPMVGRRVMPLLDQIDNARAVYELIRQQRLADTPANRA